MKLKKITAAMLAVSVLAVSAGSVYALDSLPADQAAGTDQPASVTEAQKSPYFILVKGTVKEIHEAADTKGVKRVVIEDENKNPVHLDVNQETYVINGENLKEGAVVTGFVQADKPMLLIYPPQYSPAVLSVEKEGQNVAADIFDKDLVNTENTLKLNIGENTKITLTDGTAYEGKLEEKKLVVLYDVTTRSIPAQTTPIAVVVLGEEAEQAAPEKSIGDKELFINGKVVANAPSAYMSGIGVTMIPLRATATALGYEVNWLGETKEIMIGNGISLKVGVDQYNYMKMAPIQLGTAPEMVDGTTFVPLQFFTEVLRAEKVEITADQIVIQAGDQA